MKTIFRIISQGEAQTINTQNGQSQKSTVVLQELGGRYENTFAATLLGNQITLSANEIVAASLRFTVHEYNGQHYQDITIQDIIRL